MKIFKYFEKLHVKVVLVSLISGNTYKVVLDGKSYRAAAPQAEIKKIVCQSAEKQTPKGGKIG